MGVERGQKRFNDFDAGARARWRSMVMREATGELKQNPDEGEEMSGEGKLRL